MEAAMDFYQDGNSATTPLIHRQKLYLCVARAVNIIVWIVLFSAFVSTQAPQAAEPTVLGPLLVIHDPVPSCSDDSWRTSLVRGLLAPAVRRAEIYAEAELPAWDQAAYTEFSRNGQRSGGEKMIRQRLEPLTTLVMAECIENKGRFLPAVERVLDALSLQPSWTLPAHDPDLANLRGDYSVDLNACETAHDAAWALRLMSPRLHPEVRARLVKALNERIFDPLRRAIERRSQGAALGPHWWIEGASNWNAVCVSSVVGAAYAMGRDDVGFWLAFGREASRHYLESFNDDGYSDEGPSYWNYGFGAYLRLRETLRWAQPEGPDLLSDPKARAMATYPQRIIMPGNAVAPFGDASNMTQIDPVKRAHAEVAIGWVDPDSWAALARPTASGGRLNEAVWRLWGHPVLATGNSQQASKGACSLFPISGVAVLRPRNSGGTADGLSVTLRTGGSKHHAHDDAGSYAIDIDGVIIAGDPGSPIYTKDTFGQFRRTNPFVNSYGHPVPFIDGNIQLDATQHQARWALQPCPQSASQYPAAAIDLMPVYHVDGLHMLRRDFSYDQKSGRFVGIIDRFDSIRPISFETAIVTRGMVIRDHDEIVIEQDNERIAVDINANAPFDIKFEVVEDQPSNRATRIALRLRSQSSFGCIAYRFRRLESNGNMLPIFRECTRLPE